MPIFSHILLSRSVFIWLPSLFLSVVFFMSLLSLFFFVAVSPTVLILLTYSFILIYFHLAAIFLFFFCLFHVTSWSVLVRCRKPNCLSASLVFFYSFIWLPFLLMSVASLSPFLRCRNSNCLFCCCCWITTTSRISGVLWKLTVTFGLS